MKLFSICLTTVVAFAVSLAAAANSQSPESNSAMKDQVKKLGPKNFLRLRAGGGKVEQPGTQKGTIVFVNAQALVTDAWIQEGIDYLKKDTRFNLKAQKGEFDLRAPKKAGEMTIYIVDDESLPISLVAPEGRWAALNIRPLKSDKQAFFKARVKKSISRVFAMLCGGMASNFNLSLVGPVSKASDLDKLPNAQLPFDVLNRMNPYLQHFGLTPARVATYRKACQEGWAPAPQDDVQKIIYDEVHSKPTEPIRIKFDPKKGE